MQEPQSEEPHYTPDAPQPSETPAAPARTRGAVMRRIGRVTLLVINILLVPVVIISGYGGLVSPSVSVLPAMMSMTYPLWALIEILLLIVTLMVSRRMALIPGVTLLLSLGAIWNICPLNLPHGALDDDERDRAFTLMAYNTFAFQDRDSITYPWGNRTADNILRTDADILCMVEAFSVGPDPRSGITWAQADSVVERYPYRIRGDKGSMIYSKYPVRKIEVAQPLQRYAYWLTGVADIHGRQVLIICVHLESIGLTPEDRTLYADLASGNGDKSRIRAYLAIASKLRQAFINRAEQARLLRGIIDRLGYDDVIVAGDFNDITGCYAIHQIMDADTHDAYRTAGFGPIYTYNKDRFYFNIDHILYRGDMRAVAYTRGNVPSSDHFPVTATFILDD